MKCFVSHALHNFQTRSSTCWWRSKHSRNSLGFCRIFRKLWNRYSPCKALIKLLKTRFSLAKLQENVIEFSIHDQARRSSTDEKREIFCVRQVSSRQQLGIGLKRPPNLHSFDRISSWSRYVEDSIGREIVETVPTREDECTIDLSELFLGQKFAYGAHSRLYHGVYQNQSVAVKLIMPPCNDQQLSSRLDQQFSQEVTLLSRLQHSNIIEFVGACKKPPIYCVVTEYLPGGSLKAFLHKSEPNSIPMSQVTRMALDVARGMEYLHSQGVIHRDLKSDNILMTDNFHLKIADFGISCLEAQRKSVRGFVGTYRWMAPEMIKDEIPSRKVDVYSFGIVLWELCTGLIPFADMTPVQAAFAICQEKARPTIPSRCSKELAKLMQQCWCNNPVDRPEFSQITKILQTPTIV